MRVRNILQKVEPIWIKNKNYDKIKPKITVVLPTFRRAKSGHFEKAVESVIAQKYTNWELIIIDDASTDGTEDLIKFYMENDERVSCIRHKYNLGLPAISQYEAYLRARGEFVAYIFDDNVWSYEHLYLSMKSIVKYNVKVTYGISRSFDKTHNFCDIIQPLEYLPIMNCIGNGSIVIHRDVIDTVGLYDPHLSLTRLCDWDLWQRISREFKMFNIDQVVTEEYGMGLSDSLGNTLDINPWVSLEQMNVNRNEMLKPSNFEEYDILMHSHRNTDIFKLFIRSFYEKYREKIWYDSEYDFFESSGNVKIKKRILIVLGALDATYFLGFENLKEDCVFKIAFFNSVREDDILYADSIIYVRDLYNALFLHNKFSKYNIPEYYYFDDNFVEIYDDYIKENKNGEQNNILFNIRNSFTFENLSKFKKIMVSSELLKEYVINKYSSLNVEVLPPCIIQDESFKLCEINDVINIAFMGGEFREDVFIRQVYPAIQLLSKDIKVKLVVPETLIKKIEDIYRKNENIVLLGVERSNCYNQLILEYKKENINILIHCGENNKNNKYKTKNAVINALRLGAVLITSNVEPYAYNNDVISVSNKIDDWHNNLKNICFNKEIQKNYFEKLEKMGNYEFGYDMVNNEFYNIISAINRIRIVDVLMRAQSLLLSGSQLVKKTNDQINSYEEHIIDDFLSFAILKKSFVEYTICTNKSYMHKLGLIFSTETLNIDGDLFIEILDKNGNFIKSKILSIDEINVREFCYFEFEDRIYLKNKTKIRIHIEYKDNSQKLFGIYENKLKRTLYYKFLNRIFGIKLSIPNLVYYDIK